MPVTGGGRRSSRPSGVMVHMVEHLPNKHKAEFKTQYWKKKKKLCKISLGYISETLSQKNK
jgi:hypothetical protein